MQAWHNESTGRTVLFGRRITGGVSESVTAVLNDDTRVILPHRVLFPAETTLTRIPSSAPRLDYIQAAARTGKSRNRSLGFDAARREVT